MDERARQEIPISDPCLTTMNCPFPCQSHACTLLRLAILRPTQGCSALSMHPALPTSRLWARRISLLTPKSMVPHPVLWASKPSRSADKPFGQVSRLVRRPGVRPPLLGTDRVRWSEGMLKSFAHRSGDKKMSYVGERFGLLGKGARGAGEESRIFRTCNRRTYRRGLDYGLHTSPDLASLTIRTRQDYRREMPPCFMCWPI